VNAGSRFTYALYKEGKARCTYPRQVPWTNHSLGPHCELESHIIIHTIHTPTASVAKPKIAIWSREYFEDSSDTLPLQQANKLIIGVSTSRSAARHLHSKRKNTLWDVFPGSDASTFPRQETILFHYLIGPYHLESV
jgi:hypothetical protein